jgi:ornithine cyclodeaminase
MELLDAARVRALVDPRALVEALRDAFADPGELVVPARGHHRIDDDLEATLLVMPAWQRGGWLGVKVVGHHPLNGARGLPVIHGSYLLSDASTGEPVAVLDGGELTRWRTAAASALAADHLARPEVREHLVVGAGNVASVVPQCYAAVRDVGRTRVWARDADRAAALVDRWRSEGIEAEVAPDLRAAVRTADVITTATSSTRPLVLAEDVRPGTHVDLVGGFTPSMIEADAALVTGSSLFVDVLEALHEAGDLTQPLANGTLSATDVRGTLADLAARRHTGRVSAQEVTVFKSVGTALEDLVAAGLVWEAHRAAPAAGR